MKRATPHPAGKVIAAYRGFADFLASDRSRESYERCVLDPYPAIRHIHETYPFIADWKTEFANLPLDDYARILEKTDDARLVASCDSLMTALERLLPPAAPIEIYLHLGVVGDCFIMPYRGRWTIFVSLALRVERMPIIVAAEYAHALHFQHGGTDRAGTDLAGMIVKEGISNFLVKLVQPDLDIYRAHWFMRPEAVDWCMANEAAIRQIMGPDLSRGGSDIVKRYYMDGFLAMPPEGWPAKTAYYVGYRVVERCLERMSIADLVALDADEAIRRSGFFEEPAEGQVAR